MGERERERGREGEKERGRERTRQREREHSRPYNTLWLRLRCNPGVIFQANLRPGGSVDVEKQLVRRVNDPKYQILHPHSFLLLTPQHYISSGTWRKSWVNTENSKFIKTKFPTHRKRDA